MPDPTTEYKHNTKGPYALYKTSGGEWKENASILNTELPIISKPKAPCSERNVYIRDIVGLNGITVPIDVYRVLDAYKEVVNPQLQHLIKKALAPGARGKKDFMHDLLDIKKSIDSAILMEQQKNPIS
tara:strand:+ start:238 stop:621 length:384 start_codon:yes stop_codon:yes gene_type:complete